jgi:hypothetical protein
VIDFDAPQQRADLDYVVREAQREWIGMSTLVPIALDAVSDDAPLEEQARALAELTGLLIDNGVLPGDLGAGPDSFVPWPGSRGERADRMADAVRDLERLPVTGEVAWFTTP